MKYLIVNVDDLGGSRGVNRGILETLLSRGAVTGCSPGRRPGEVYAFDCCRSCGLKRIPLLGKGGVDAPSRNIPVTLKVADGVVRSNSKTILLNEPPCRRPLRWLRDIFLKAQPPLLCQGGEFASSHNFGNNQMAQRGYIRLPLRGFDRMRFARHFGQQ